MLRTYHIRSLAELRARAADWDDLWQRSEATIPAARAELLAQWSEHFAPRCDFHAVIVEARAQWLAALPLVCRRIAGLVKIAMLPSGPWSAGGQLLWAPDCAGEETAAALVEALRGVPCHLLWLQDTRPQEIGWHAAMAAVAARGMTCDCRPREPVARIEIGHDWEAFRGSWSRKHRQKISACLRRLAARGEVRLRLLSDLDPNYVEPWLRQSFQIEDRGWKGEAGTSVLRTRGMSDFFLRQARQAAEWGQLELALLECGGRAVAFSYGLTAKGVFHSCKIGYDAEFADCSPGQLLRYHLLEAFHADPARRAIDFMGPMTESHACWRPESCPVARLALAPRGRLASAALRLYRARRS